MKKEKSSKKKIAKRIVSSILGIFIVLVIGIQIFGLVSARSNYGVSNFFGYQTLVVLTDSMEDELPVGSGLIVKRVDTQTLEIDDIISFYRPSDRLIVTHRIIDIDEGQERYFTCLGDNIFAQTCPPAGCTIANADYIAARYVLGKVIVVSKPLGALYSFISHPVSMFLVVIVPLGAIAVLSAIDFVKAARMKTDSNLLADKQSKIKEEMLKEIKQTMKDQIKEDLKNYDNIKKEDK